MAAWKGRLAATVAVSRADPFSSSTSIADRTGGEQILLPASIQQTRFRKSFSLLLFMLLCGLSRCCISLCLLFVFALLTGLNSSRMYSAPSLYRQTPLSSTKSRNEKNKFDKNNTSMLVTMRERKKGVRDSIEKCLIHVEKYPVAEQGGGFNSLSELVVVCLESLEEMKVMQGCGGSSSSNNHREGEEEENRLDQYLERQNDHRAWLITLLCAYPETFHAILDIIGETRNHYRDQAHQNEKTTMRYFAIQSSLH